MFTDDKPVNADSTSMQIDEISNANGAAIDDDNMQALNDIRNRFSATAWYSEICRLRKYVPDEYIMPPKLISTPPDPSPPLYAQLKKQNAKLERQIHVEQAWRAVESRKCIALQKSRLDDQKQFDEQMAAIKDAHAAEVAQLERELVDAEDLIRQLKAEREGLTEQVSEDGKREQWLMRATQSVDRRDRSMNDCEIIVIRRHVEQQTIESGRTCNEDKQVCADDVPISHVEPDNTFVKSHTRSTCVSAENLDDGCRQNTICSVCVNQQTSKRRANNAGTKVDSSPQKIAKFSLVHVP